MTLFTKMIITSICLLPTVVLSAQNNNPANTTFPLKYTSPLNNNNTQQHNTANQNSQLSNQGITLGPIYFLCANCHWRYHCGKTHARPPAGMACSNYQEVLSGVMWSTKPCSKVCAYPVSSSEVMELKQPSTQGCVY